MQDFHTASRDCIIKRPPLDYQLAMRQFHFLGFNGDGVVMIARLTGFARDERIRFIHSRARDAGDFRR